jgi:hypothetical protein
MKKATLAQAHQVQRGSPLTFEELDSVPCSVEGVESAATWYFRFIGPNTAPATKFDGILMGRFSFPASVFRRLPKRARRVLPVHAAVIAGQTTSAHSAGSSSFSSILSDVSMRDSAISAVVHDSPCACSSRNVASSKSRWSDEPPSLRSSRTLRLFEATPLGSFGGGPRVNPIPEAPQTSSKGWNWPQSCCTHAQEMIDTCLLVGDEGN